jgi:NAD(P)-dependent dehydrogenase (short-subunit alcohol dehydrogenase family)
MWFFLADTNEEEIDCLAKDLALRYKIHADGWEVDITKEAEVKAMVEAAAAMTGRVDYAANCAGVLYEMPGGQASQTTLDIMQWCVFRQLNRILQRF